MVIKMVNLCVMSHWRRLYLDLRIWLGLKLFKQPHLPITGGRDPSRPIVNIGFGQYLKASSTAEEIYALQYVRHATTIPVPEVFGAWFGPCSFRFLYVQPDDRFNCCVVMSSMPGKTLGSLWDGISEDNKTTIFQQLMSYIEELREIGQPSVLHGRICSFTGRSMFDPGLCTLDDAGPFSKSEFIEYALNVWIEDRSAKEARFKKVLSRDMDEHGLCLTHCDLHPYNIIVDKASTNGEYKVTGIIDWATSGWYPIYWEAFRMRYPVYPLSGWSDIAKRFTEEFDEEITVLEELGSTTFR